MTRMQQKERHALISVTDGGIQHLPHPHPHPHPKLDNCKCHLADVLPFFNSRCCDPDFQRSCKQASSPRVDPVLCDVTSFLIVLTRVVNYGFIVWLIKVCPGSGLGPAHLTAYLLCFIRDKVNPTKPCTYQSNVMYRKTGYP